MNGNHGTFWRSGALTPEGGLAVPVINNTGHTSIKGELVEASHTVDNAADLAEADAVDVIGVVYQAGVPVGGRMLIVVAGNAQVLLQDTTACTRGQWARTSVTVAGRMTTSAVPAQPANTNHFFEIGHVLESKNAGTNVLATISMHFN
jgi:hypothetical protein